MTNSQLFAYDQSAALASDLGKYILRIQNDVLLKNSSFNVAVSGGSLVNILQLALIEDPEISHKINWQNWKIYFSDERLVPLHDKDSNYKLFYDKVISKLTEKQIPGPEVFTINESLIHESNDHNDAKIAHEYESLLPANHEFDLILLGLGPDGHTASLFPNHKGLQITDQWVFNINDSPKPPPRRISFSLPLIKKAKNIAFVAEGSAKAPVLKQIFDSSKSNLPGELVNELPIPVKWFVNTPAIEGVNVKVSKFE